MVGEGARVSVDPGRSIQIRGADQITVLGRLDAWGGRISIQEPRVGEQPYVPKANPRSVWIGEQAVLDTAGRSHVATDARGRRYGTVQAGGAIEIGGTLNWEADVDTRTRPIDRHVILRPGSLLDASGTQAVLDLPGRGATLVGSDGGSIVLASANSLHLDGALRGGRFGAGGRRHVGHCVRRCLLPAQPVAGTGGAAGAPAGADAAPGREPAGRRPAARPAPSWSTARAAWAWTASRRAASTTWRSMPACSPTAT